MRGSMNDLELKDNMGDSVKGKTYATMDGSQAKYQASLIQYDIISLYIHTFLIYTVSTHSFISLMVMASLILKKSFKFHGRCKWKTVQRNGSIKHFIYV